MTRDYDGSENETLAAQVHVIGAQKAGDLFSRLANVNAREFWGACVDLLRRLVHTNGQQGSGTSAFREMAEAIVAAVGEAGRPGNRSDTDWRRVRKTQAADAAMVADLLDSVAALGPEALRERAAAAFTTNVPAFDPGVVLVPALASTAAGSFRAERR